MPAMPQLLCSRMPRTITALAVAALLAACTTPTQEGDRTALPRAATTQGELLGRSEAGLAAFKGIPFAAPPVGERRWRPPAAAQPWTGVREAAEFGPACVQPEVPAESVYNDPPHAQSEDCLTLNIWAPESARKAPVVVWIHGGSLRIGAGSQRMYDGSAYARRGAVFISINYRLGPLGWMAHPQLSAESPSGISGNYGLLDQIAALEWVRDNAAAFGGDPDNVTIMGESAGALSATYLMVSPQARGLFHKAIIQSTNVRSFPELAEARNGMPSGEQIGSALLEKLGAADFGSARSIDAQSLTDRATLSGFAPQGTIDGVLLPGQLIDLFDRGEQARVPVIVGYNAHEYRPEGGPGLRMPQAPEQYATEAGEIFGDLAPEFLRLYPHEQGDDALLDATGDAIFGWSGERIARSQAQLGLASFFYVFDHCYPAAEARDLCAFHASELPFTFGEFGAEAMPARWPVPDGAHDRAISNAMLDYWTSFAASGTPTAKGHPDWQPYSSAEAYLRFDDAPIAGRDFKPGMFELHETFAAMRRAAGQPWGMATSLGTAAATANQKRPE